VIDRPFLDDHAARKRVLLEIVGREQLLQGLTRPVLAIGAMGKVDCDGRLVRLKSAG
jgi:hypothetical protein